ncbi:MAG: hybrid sensor histidine kinase/response regulator [Leptolyngbyaceae cyanobacterium bins.59]|nr:hybrid sensor histidine kinase/response regulator [Leptolyngbyaceae cyanobacterium bins.59]
MLGDLLIVDDIPDNLRVLTAILSARGYRVRQAKSGSFALNIIRINPPDLVLLDVLMPGMDGYEVCRQLKANPQSCHIPVIFLSALDDSLDKVKSFQVGGCDYITKPFEVSEVLARIENHLQLNRLQKELRMQKDQLEERNVQLEQEIRIRMATENALQLLNVSLEEMVESRTIELKQRNEELLELQGQLQQALEREQALSQAKSQLLNTIAHEFRTPLSVIGTSTGLLKFRLQAAGDEQNQRYFQRIDRSIERIVRVLDNALTLGQVASRYVTFNPSPMQLTAFCEGLLAEWEQPDEASHQISLVVEGTPPANLQADPVLLRHILNNLIANALRYSPQGGPVTLKILYEPDRVLVSLTDQGIGIPEEEQEKIFEHFYRASNADSIPGMPGAGLGLAVVRQLVELHQGRIEVQSQVKQGTQFIISIPVGSKSEI